MYDYETLVCQACGDLFSRVVVRGRKPNRCMICREFNRPVRKAPAKVVEITDGGRIDAGYYGERSDCTVRALATATGASYDEAYRFMAANGRKKNKGAYFERAIAQHQVLGHTFIKTPTFVKARGINAAIKRNPVLRYGTWVLKMKGHVATLKDGKILDSFDSSRKDILWAWSVQPLK